MNKDEFDRGVFEGEVLAELRAIKKLGDEVKEHLRFQDLRITKLELEYSRAKGVILAVGTIAGLFSSLVAQYLPALLASR